MAGTIKLDGTQFLEKVNNEFKITNSELKLKSTGNTIVDSSGNAVVSESGGNVTLGNVRLPSTGGIKDSSGNNILTESGGTTTLTADEANVGSNALVVNSSGNVGIGTSSPSSSLNISNGFIEVDINGTQSIRVGSTDSIVGGTDNEAVFQSNTGKGMRFLSGGTERMRIDSSGNLKFNSGYGSVATAYGCRAWVNFDGTGTPAIRASGNVSSITDNSTGNYTVNFTTAMPDTYYAIISPNVHQPGIAVWDITFRTDSITTGSCGIQSMNTANTATGDTTHLSLAIFR